MIFDGTRNPKPHSISKPAVIKSPTNQSLNFLFIIGIFDPIVNLVPINVGIFIEVPIVSKHTFNHAMRRSKTSCGREIAERIANIEFRMPFIY